MKAITLAGGFSTRLRPLTLTKPKPLLTVLGKPLLEWIINMLKQANINEIIFSVRYLSHAIKSRFGSGIDYGVNIEYVEEDKPLGDAGPLKLISEKIGIDTTFIVVYGDVFCDIDLTRVVEFHRRKGGLATIVLTEVDDPSRYGIAVLDEDSRITKFIEKPRREEAPSKLANAGIYVFEPEVLKYIPEKTPSKLGKDVIPRLVKDGVVYGYVYRGIWGDIGVPEDYLKINIEVLGKYYPNGYIHSSAKIDDDVEIVHPVFIDRNVQVSRGSVIGPYCIIEGNVRIRGFTRIRESLIQMGTTIEYGTLVVKSIIGEKCHIGKWVRVDEGVVIGDEVVVADEVYIARRVRILPFKEVDESIHSEGEIIL